jgi:hypothetical protein
MRHLRLYLNGVTELVRQVGENNDNLYVNLASLLTAMGSELAGLMRSQIASGAFDAAGGLLVVYEGVKLYYSPSKAAIAQTAMDYEALFTAFRQTSQGETRAAVDRQYQDLLLADKQIQKVQLARHFQIANVLCLLSNISFGLWNITHPTVYCQSHGESGDCHHIASNPNGNWTHHVELCKKNEETGSCSYQEAPAWSEVVAIVFSMLNILFVFLHVLVCAVFLADIETHKNHLLEDVRSRFDRKDKDVLSLDLAGSYCDILEYDEKALDRVRDYVNAVIAEGGLEVERNKKISLLDEFYKVTSNRFRAKIQLRINSFKVNLIDCILVTNTDIRVSLENAARQLENELESIYNSSARFKKSKIILMINNKFSNFKVEVTNVIANNSPLYKRMMRFSIVFRSSPRVFDDSQKKVLDLIDTFQLSILDAFEAYLDQFFQSLKVGQSSLHSHERNRVLLKELSKNSVAYDSLPSITTNPFSFTYRNKEGYQAKFDNGAGLSQK